MHVPQLGEDHLRPDAAAWRSLPADTVPLVPVPLDAQPNEYIRTAWSQRPYGGVREVRVTAARHSERLFVRLEWACSQEPNGEFLDGAGVFFPQPGHDDPPLTIGSRSSPVRLWAWHDRLAVQQALPPVTELVARGPGVFRPLSSGADPEIDDSGRHAQDLPGEDVEPQEVSGESERSEGRWTVVLSGSVTASSAARMGIVVWDGANEERAGIGAVTPSWVPLAVE